MVKGVSRQVIVVHSPDPNLFDQAIFILKDDAVSREGITDEVLMKEARRLINSPASSGKNRSCYTGPVWACLGALATGCLWLLTVLI